MLVCARGPRFFDGLCKIHSLRSERGHAPRLVAPPKDDVERVGAELRNLHDLGEAGGVETAKAGAGLDVFEGGQDCPSERFLRAADASRCLSVAMA